MNKTAFEHSRAFLLFVVTALLFLWPLSFQIFTFKNDALTYYYPVRTLISDALNHGELPLWTPYINMGYPLHADFQSGAWNPFVWLFSYATGYPLVAMHYECIFYFCLAGMGMYLLAREYGAEIRIALLAGLAYQFSGFMLDSIQFFTCISSACWIPYIFLYFRKTLNENYLKNPALLSLFLALLLLCGYPAFLIITFYLLLFYLIIFIWDKRKQNISWGIRVSQLGLSLFLFLLLTAPAILSYYYHLPFINRGTSQSLEIVQQNSMNPATVISLLFPFSSLAPNSFLDSELLMRTIYIGILPLCLLFSIWRQPKCEGRKKGLIYLALAVLMLFLAFGKYFFLRKLAFEILPGMDMFRHPGLFRLFFIFFCIVAIIRAFPHIATGISDIKKQGLAFLVIAAILWAFGLFLRISGKASFIAFDNSFFNAAGFWQRIFFEALFVTGFSLLLVFFPKQSVSKYVIALVIIDLFISTQIHQVVTGVGAKPYQKIVASLNRNKILFPLPDQSSVAENSKGSTDSLFEAGSRMPFRKLVGRNDYFITPGNLLMQDSFYQSAIRDSLFKRPLISLFNNHSQVKITNMGANKIEGSFFTSNTDSLLLLQNHYPGWQAYIDGKETRISTSAICFMAVPVNTGNHTFQFIYSPSYLRWAIWLPMAGLLLIIISWKLSRVQSEKLQMEI